MARAASKKSKPKQEDMAKVVVASPMVGICHMVVCCEVGSKSDEILAVCNSQNPSGTSMGWCTVYKKNAKDKSKRPVKCNDYENRLHVLVSC